MTDMRQLSEPSKHSIVHSYSLWWHLHSTCECDNQIGSKKQPQIRDYTEQTPTHIFSCALSNGRFCGQAGKQCRHDKKHKVESSSEILTNRTIRLQTIRHMTSHYHEYGESTNAIKLSNAGGS